MLNTFGNLSTLHYLDEFIDLNNLGDFSPNNFIFQSILHILGRKTLSNASACSNLESSLNCSAESRSIPR